MRKLFNYVTMVLGILLTVFLTSCNSSTNHTFDLMMGTYMTEDGNVKVNLSDDNKYVLNIIFVSRHISGSYSVNGNKLILHDGELDIEFLIDTNKIVFVGAYVDGKEEDWIVKPRKDFILQLSS